MRISDWSSDVCSSDLTEHSAFDLAVPAQGLLTLVRVIDDRVRVVDWAHRLQRVDGLPGNIAKFGDPPTDVCAVGIELLPLRDRVEDAEERRSIRTRPGSPLPPVLIGRSEEHTSELQSLMRISYAVFCLQKKKCTNNN